MDNCLRYWQLISCVVLRVAGCAIRVYWGQWGCGAIRGAWLVDMVLLWGIWGGVCGLRGWNAGDNKLLTINANNLQLIMLYLQNNKLL